MPPCESPRYPCEIFLAATNPGDANSLTHKPARYSLLHTFTAQSEEQALFKAVKNYVAVPDTRSTQREPELIHPLEIKAVLQ